MQAQPGRRRYDSQRSLPQAKQTCTEIADLLAGWCLSSLSAAEAVYHLVAYHVGRFFSSTMFIRVLLLRVHYRLFLSFFSLLCVRSLRVNHGRYWSAPLLA